MNPFLFIVLMIGCVQAQADQISSQKYSFLLANLLQHNVPEISVKELATNKSQYILLDTREESEFRISHIEGARYVGYEYFNLNTIKDLDKSSKIVCYCSVGYRSERIARKLMDLGFSEVSNLYGSIFEWVNCKYPIVDLNKLPTNKMHAYSRIWSSFITNNNIVKVF